MAKTSIIFLGSKPVGYRCLAHLLRVAGELNAEVIGLLTQVRGEFGDDHDLAALADEYDVPILSSPEDMPGCDILLSVQYHCILTPVQLSKARQMAVNLHMAPLPEYRGSNQFTHAILDGKKEFGTTLHVMDARIDHGGILAQRRWPILPRQWVEELYLRTVEESVALFAENIAAVISGQLTAVPQAELVHQYGTALHLRAGMETLKTLDLSWPTEKLERHLRATYMPGFEPPYAWVCGRKVHLIPEQITT